MKYCALFICCVLEFDSLSLRADERTDTRQTSKPEKAVVMLLHPTVSLKFEFSDAEMLDKLIVKPLKNARPDPARGYSLVGYGELRIRFKDGDEQIYFLFCPWGHIAKFDKKTQESVPMVADLTELQRTLRERSQDALKRALDTDFNKEEEADLARSLNERKNEEKNIPK